VLTDVVIAFAAGTVSFFAPCVVPLLPAYVSYLGGSALPELSREGAAPEVGREAQSRFQRRVLGGSLQYVLGFGLVFVLLGVGAGLLGTGLRAHEGVLQRAGGVLVIAMGLALSGLLPASIAQRSFAPLRAGAGGAPGRRGLTASPILLGVVFGTAWTPCVGPVLASILVLAADSHRAGTGAVLLSAYTAGLGVPFALAGLTIASFPGALRPLARFSEAVSRVAGVLLIVLGVLLVLGLYTALAGYLAVPFSG
jgi:cytochrome c-type biogenesis protein